jgi:hypothetical protein
MKTFALSDQNSSVNFTVWGEAISTVELNHTYEFTNLSVSNFNDIKHLQTTPATTVVEIEQIEACTDMPEQGNFTTVTNAMCDSVQCELTYLCNSCKKTSSLRT